MSGKDYIEKHGFMIPEEYLMVFVRPFMEQSLEQLPQEMSEQAEGELEARFSEMLTEFQENKIEPLEPYLPLLIALMLFFSLYTITNFLTFIPIYLIGFMIWILLRLKVVKIVTEKREVEHLVLDD